MIQDFILLVLVSISVVTILRFFLKKSKGNCSKNCTCGGK